MAQGKLDSHRQNTDTIFVPHAVQKSTQNGQNTPKTEAAKALGENVGVGELQLLLQRKTFW